MRQIFQNPKSGKTTLEEVPSPAVKDGGVLVRNSFSVISAGTERSIIELSKKGLVQKAKERPDYVQKFLRTVKTKGLVAAWGIAQSKLNTDIALGYSSAGEVIGVGRGVEDFRAGDRVACAGQNYASHADFVFVPKNLAVHIPAAVTDEEAAFATLGAIAMQGIRQARLTAGEKVAVVGLGLLGQIAVKLLKAYGHPVIGFDVNDDQIKFGMENGLDEGVLIGSDYKGKLARFSNSRGVDAVIIYASSKTDEPLKLAVDILRDKGRIVQVGMVLSNVPWRDFMMKELSYLPSRSYGAGRYDRNYEEGGNDYPFGYVRWTEKRNMEEFVRLLAAGEVSVKNLISHVFDITEAEKAYELIFGQKKPIHGILLRYPKENVPVQTLKIAENNEEVKSSEPKENINIAIIGLGSFAKSTILPVLRRTKGVKLAMVCDAQGMVTKKTAKEWGADSATTDYREILKNADIDLVVCATRHSSHAEIAKEVLAADKNLYIEKPLALNENELGEVMEVAKRSKGKLFVGFNRRFSRHFLEARKRFPDSKVPIQVIYRVNAGALENDHWSLDSKEGGRLIGEGCHFVDALCFLCQSRPAKVFAAGIPIGGGITHEDNFSINIEFENGSLGTIVYSSLGNFRLPKEYLEIYSEGKVMTINDFKESAMNYPNKTENLGSWRQDKGYEEEIKEIILAIRGGKSSPVNLRDIFFSHLVTFKAEESLRSGKVIEIDAR